MRISKEEILEILNKYETYLLENDSGFGTYAIKRYDFDKVAMKIVELIKEKIKREKRKMKQYKLKMDFFYDKKLFKKGTVISQFWTKKVYYSESDGITFNIIENNPLVFEPLKESKVKVKILNMN